MNLPEETSEIVGTRTRSNSAKRFFGIEESQFVPPEALDVLHHQGKMHCSPEAKFDLEAVYDILDSGGRIILEGFGLTVFQKDFEDIGHQSHN